jgi:hypothetical protein
MRRVAGYVCVGCGFLLVATMFYWFVGIPLIVLGNWLLRR